MFPMSNDDSPFAERIREQFVIYARENGLLDTSKRPPIRHCPVGHELPDEVVTKYGLPMWRQIQECPKCQAQNNKAQMMDKILARFEHCGIPEMFQTWTTGTTEGNRTERRHLLVDESNFAARLACAAFGGHKNPDKDSLPWVLFAGNVGVGKTTWASALFCDLVDEQERATGSSKIHRRCGADGLWMTEADLFIKADEAHHRDGYTARTAFLSKVCKVSLLLLDDLGGNRRGLTEWQGGALRHLFDYRHKHRLPTLMTTNLQHWRLLADRYGDHVVSRMIDQAKSMTILKGDDRRLRG